MSPVLTIQMNLYEFQSQAFNRLSVSDLFVFRLSETSCFKMLDCDSKTFTFHILNYSKREIFIEQISLFSLGVHDQIINVKRWKKSYYKVQFKIQTKFDSILYVIKIDFIDVSNNFLFRRKRRRRWKNN